VYYSLSDKSIAINRADMASPSKATAYVGWAPDPWSLRVQSQQTFDLSDAGSNKSAVTTPSISLPTTLYRSAN